MNEQIERGLKVLGTYQHIGDALLTDDSSREIVAGYCLTDLFHALEDDPDTNLTELVQLAFDRLEAGEPRIYEIERLVKSGAYGWIITEDHKAEEGAAAPSNLNAVGMVGGSDTPFTDMEIRCLGLLFELYDDDGELYYTGLYLGADDEGVFNPLEDFGTPNAGAVGIKYRSVKTGLMEFI